MQTYRWAKSEKKESTTSQVRDDDTEEREREKEEVYEIETQRKRCRWQHRETNRQLGIDGKQIRERESLRESQQEYNDRAGKEQISLDKKHEREKGKDRYRGNRERDNQTGRQVDRREILKGRESRYRGRVTVLRDRER